MKKSRNHLAVIQLKLLGFPILNIRKALSKLTGIEHKDAARIVGTTRSNVTQHIGGVRTTPETMASLAMIYEVPVDELFSDRPSIDRIEMATGVFDSAIQNLQDKREELFHVSEKTQKNHAS